MFSQLLDVPESAFALPPDCTQELNEIITRHKNYVAAKANGTLGTSVNQLKVLNCRSQKLRKLTNQSVVDSDDIHCSLCLEPMQTGEEVVSLPCGHTFHSGKFNEKEKREGSLVKSSKKRNRANADSCRGVLYWLENHASCPQCRFEFPTELPAPTPSESLLVPLLHRQNRLISKQMEIINAQKRQLSQLTSSTRTNPNTPISHNLELYESKNSRAELRLPRLSWQNSSCVVQKQARKLVLERVTDVALRDIVVKGAMNERCKAERLQELAAKIEFILYCCSQSFAEYSDWITLRQRTLQTVKNLAERARAMKLQQPLSQSQQV